MEICVFAIAVLVPLLHIPLFVANNSLELVQKKSKDISILVQNLKDTFSQIKSQTNSIGDISQTNVARIQSVVAELQCNKTTSQNLEQKYTTMRETLEKLDKILNLD